MQPERRRKSQKLVGSAKPREAPPVPARADVKGFAAIAEKIGRPLWPWQLEGARYINAPGIDRRWLYREVAIVAARQNGKTTILETLILERLLSGQRIVHAAQTRELPRETHDRVATILEENFREVLPRKRGIQRGAGMEQIRLTTGGHYRIVAATRAGARGMPYDLVLADEVLEMADTDFMAAARSTILASRDGQIVYFSNAGYPWSVVLNSLRARAGNDPRLAYLEWSADPKLAPDDIKGWLQANPSIGHNPAILPNLEDEYRAHLLGESLDVWERENLCRPTLTRNSQAIVLAEDWQRQEFSQSLIPQHPLLGVKMDIGGERASAVLAWPENQRIAVDVVADVEGHPIDVDRLGPDLEQMARSKRVLLTGYDPYTDADIARHFRRAKALTGRDYASASERFVRLVAARSLHVHDADGLLAKDLAATIRRNASGGAYVAVKASAEATNTAAEAAIRAVWLASEPRPTPRIG